MQRDPWWMAAGVLAVVVACTQAAQQPDPPLDTDDTESVHSEPDTDTGHPSTGDTEPTDTQDTAPSEDTEDTEPTDTGDVFEGWPSTEFIPTHCGSCHPNEDGGGTDFLIYEELVREYDHVYCGISPEWVPECGDAHEPGHLPRSEEQPSEEDRLRMTAWLAAWMPREDGTTMCDHGYAPHHDNDCGDTGSPWGP